MNSQGYIACICEGNSESAIIDILLDDDALIFNRSRMLEQQIIRCRNGKRFEERYLRKGFDCKITVYRILDSRRENFRISKAYRNKIEIIDIITAPEIEMLMIHNEDRYIDFKKRGISASDYCKLYLKFNDVKSYQFVRNYFSDVKNLKDCIQIYKQKAKIKKDENPLFDLLK